MGLDELSKHFSAAPAAKASGRAYVVRQGDTLTSIAKRAMNDDSRDAVRKLFEANRSRLASPNQLVVGMELTIPS
jgi:nucleoid-associated protein YgaU